MKRNKSKEEQVRATSYAEAGVNTTRAEHSLAGLLEWVKKTESLRPHLGAPVMDIGYFANVIRLTDTLGLAISTDGVGTKILLAQQLDNFASVGIDCVAMNVNDVLCVGAEPLALVDYLAVEEPDAQLLAAIGESLYQGAVQARIVIPGGELAQVGEMIRGSEKGRAFDLVGTCVGTVELDRLIVGEDLSDGDVVIGLASTGPHSNGYTLVRRVLQQAGRDPRSFVDELGMTLGEALLEPTAIYVPQVQAIAQTGVRPKALIHVTGDGLLNLTRVKADASFELHSLPETPAVFRLIQDMGGIPDAEMYSTFNMGVGFCVVCSRDESDACMRAIAATGCRARHIGEVILDGKREVRLPRQGLLGYGKRFRGAV